jgi:hypothetical protein
MKINRIIPTMNIAVNRPRTPPVIPTMGRVKSLRFNRALFSIIVAFSLDFNAYLAT